MSPLHSPPLSSKSSEENKDLVSPQLSPKRSYSSHDEGELRRTDMDTKRRHLHPESDKRAPLDPLTASELQNRRSRSQTRSPNDSTRSLKSSTSVPDLRSPLQQESGRSYEMVYSSSSSEIQTHTWPPHSHTINITQDDSSLRNHGKNSGGTGLNVVPPRDSNNNLSPAWPPPVLHNTTTSSTSDSSASQGWSPSAFTPGDGDDPVVFRPRSNSLPLVRRPPADLWQPEPLESSIPEHRSPFLSPPARTVYGTIQSDSILYSTPPPGLPHSAKRRLASGAHPQGDLELVPLASTERSIGSVKTTNGVCVKPMAPIGAERSRVLSMLSSKPTPSTNPSRTPSRSTSLPPPSSWKQSLVERSSSPAAMSTGFSAGRNTLVPEIREKMQLEERLSTKELDRLFLRLRLNEHSPKTVSPLSPLRNPPPDLVWSAQAKVMSRTSSFRNEMSARYRQGPEQRSRTICDRYQSREVEGISGHCQECRRDSMGKKLLSRRLRQSSWPVRMLRGSSYSGPIAVIGDYGEIIDEADEEEGSLWDEVRAATSREPFLTDEPQMVDTNYIFPPASPRVQDLHEFDSDLPEIPDEDLFSESDEEMLDITSNRSLF